MKLLFDQNISLRLVSMLEDIFPDSMHVAEAVGERASDIEVWNWASENKFTIISKDSDFNDLAALHGSPPAVIWIRRGNCSTSDVEELIRSNQQAIRELANASAPDILILQ